MQSARLPAPAIVAIGARGPLGLSALQLAMGVRARKLVPTTTLTTDKRGHLCGAATAWGLPRDLAGYDRLIALGAPALREAGVELAGAVPLLLAVAEPGRPDDDARVETALVADLGARSGVAIDVGRSQLFRTGQAGFAAAMGEALRRLRSGEARALLVGGLDSYLHPEVLAWLDRDDRLHAPGADDGFIPGEGAAFALLCREPGDVASAGKAPLPVLARLVDVELGREETVLSGEPNLGAAMTAVLARLAAASPEGSLDWVLSDVNGERHRIREFTMASGRGQLRAGAEHSRFVDDLGDLGAATGAVLLGLATSYFRAGVGPAKDAAIALSSEGAERGAFLIEAAPVEEARRESAPAAQAKRSPAALLAPALRDAVELALLRLPELPPRLDRAPILAAAEAATAAVACLGASDVDEPEHLDHLGAAAGALSALREAHEGIGGEAAERSREALAAAERALGERRSATIEAVVSVQEERRGRASSAGALGLPELVASVGVPRLHAFPAAALVPALPYAAPARDDDDDEDAGEAPRPPARPALGPEDHDLLDCARQCAADVGLLSLLRATDDEEPFTEGVLRFEQRMLDALDAFAALARPSLRRGADNRWSSKHLDLLAEIERWSLDAAAPDPARAFAAAFLLGCVEGEDAARAAGLLLRRAPAELYPAWIEGLGLAPSPAIDAAMARLAGEDDAALARLALDVLHRRRAPSFAAAAMLVDHPDAGVRRSAARCLGLAAERGPAAALLAELLEPDEDPSVSTAAAESLLLLGAPSGLAFLRKSLRDELRSADALPDRVRLDQLRLLALSGGPADAEILLHSFRGRPEEARAMGWHGHAALVEPLIAVLERANADSPEEVSSLEFAAAQALFRITGAPLLHPSSDDPEAPAARSPLTEAEPWKRWWAEHKGAFGGQKVRFGQPFSAVAGLAELSQEGVTASVRADCALEVAIVSGGTIPLLDVRAFAARQREQLAAIVAALPKDRRGRPSLGVPGEWPERALGHRS
ncbi:MAG: HEAT repeat domain-containing protein [Byssovorax sp.]